MQKALLMVLTLFITLTASGQTTVPDSLSAIDQQFMQQQRDTIDHLARLHLGEQLRQSASDLVILQRLLDQQLVARDDTLTLQAMGVVLGDRLAADEGLEWVIYTDRKGRSRALQIPGSKEMLFPITMISRRYETGLNVDVQALYDQAVNIVAEVRHRRSPF